MALVASGRQVWCAYLSENRYGHQRRSRQRIPDRELGPSHTRQQRRIGHRVLRGPMGLQLPHSTRTRCMGAAMRKERDMRENREMFLRQLCILVAILSSMQAAYAQQVQADEIPGYRHTAAKSRFFAGERLARLKPVEENGFVKYRGINGVIATDERTGLTLPGPSASQ